MKNQHVMTIFAGVMLVYTAWRTFDYMGGSLLDVSTVVRLIISVAFLCFSEIGLLVWLHSAQPNATTDLQETTASIMIWTDFAGSMIVGLADLAKHNTIYQVDLSIIDPLLFLAPWLMVVLNVGGYLIYHQNDSESKLDRADRRLRHKEHELEISARMAAMRELENNKQALAEKLSPHYYRDIHDRVTGRTLNRFARQAEQLPAANEPSTPALLPADQHVPPFIVFKDEAYTGVVSQMDGAQKNGKSDHPNGQSRGE